MSAANRNRRRCMRRSTTGGFVHSSPIFILILILGAAVTARSQAPTDAKELHLPNVPRWTQPSNMPGAQTAPAVVFSSNPNGMQRMQPGQVSIAGTQAEQANASMPPIAPYRFVNINVPNSNWIQADGVNNAGQVVGWYQDSSNTPRGFLWQNGVLETLDYPGSIGTHFNGINNKGVIIGEYLDLGFNWHGFTYVLSSKSWTELPDIPGYLSNDPASINDNGAAVGTAQGGGFGLVAWIWNSETQSYSFFTVPGAEEADTTPTGINNANRVVGIYGTYPRNNNPSGFLKEECRKEEDTMYVHIDVPGALTTSLSGISNNGVIVGNYEMGSSSTGYTGGGFLKTADGVFRTVNDTSATGTIVQGVNDHQVLCGYIASNGAVLAAFVAYPQ